MNKDKRFPRLANCPICHGELEITTIKCQNCGLELKDNFNLSVFDRLETDNYNFLITFLKCKGNLKRLQTEMNISYPFAKKQLDLLLQSLGLEEKSDCERSATNLNDIIVDYNSTKASEIIKYKLIKCGGTAVYHTFYGKKFGFRILADGNRFVCDSLPSNVDYTFEIFDVVVDSLISQGGEERKGNARNYKLGEKNCDLTTVAGVIGKRYFRKNDGESVLDPVFIISAILEWAGIADNCRGYIKLTQAYKSKVYL